MVLHSFRNIEQQEIDFTKKINVFYGKNGQGKTNLLEAIFLLSAQKSFRSDTPYEMVQFQKVTSKVGAKVFNQGVTRKIEIEIDKDLHQKKCFIDGKPVRATESLTNLRSLLVSQEEFMTLYGKKNDRRRFLDKAVWNFSPTYLSDYRNYERVLKQRNSALRENTFGGQVLLVFDEAFVTYGAKVIFERLRFIKEISALFWFCFMRVYGEEQKVELCYRINKEVDKGDKEVLQQESLADLEQLLKEGLRRSYKEDCLRGYTTMGPHTDDFCIMLMQKEAQKYASQGQKKALLLAEKLAEVELLKTQNIEPVLLLDEVKSDLDDQKIEHLFYQLLMSGCQSFVTTTTPKDVDFIENKENFEIVSGSVVASKKM